MGGALFTPVCLYVPVLTKPIIIIMSLFFTILSLIVNPISTTRRFAYVSKVIHKAQKQVLIYTLQLLGARSKEVVGG